MKVFKKLVDSTRWSLAGLSYSYKHELSFRIEVFVALILTPTALYISSNLNQRLWLLSTVYAILVVELLNTAIEATVNRISMEKHNLSKYAKDAGSAAVFCTVMFMLLVWALVLIDIYC